VLWYGRHNLLSPITSKQLTDLPLAETDCNPKHDLAEFLANYIIYRYLCSSEDLLQDVLGGMDALAAFGNRMRRDTLTQVVSVRR
jgi:hypothetical protein